MINCFFTTDTDNLILKPADVTPKYFRLKSGDGTELIFTHRNEYNMREAVLLELEGSFNRSYERNPTRNYILSHVFKQQDMTCIPDLFVDKFHKDKPCWTAEKEAPKWQLVFIGALVLVIAAMCFLKSRFDRAKPMKQPNPRPVRDHQEVRVISLDD